MQHSKVVGGSTVRVREVLAYDPETGQFTWRVSTGPRGVAGARAGTTNLRGYIEISLDGRKYLAHRLVWAHVYGIWPDDQIDHINGDRADNRIVNLRDVPRAINQQNLRRASKYNCSGLLGVSKHNARWRARIQTEGVVVRLGTFDTAQQAHEAYLAAKRQMHIGCTI
jgi:hypothetical protein